MHSSKCCLTLAVKLKTDYLVIRITILTMLQLFMAGSQGTKTGHTILVGGMACISILGTALLSATSKSSFTVFIIVEWRSN